MELLKDVSCLGSNGKPPWCMTENNGRRGCKDGLRLDREGPFKSMLMCLKLIL